MEEEILKEIEEKENNKPANEIVEIDENEEITNTQYDMEKVIPKKDEKKSNKISGTGHERCSGNIPDGLRRWQ